MYLSKIKLTNFRKFEALELDFQKGLNLLVGENDGGKTAVIDAIRIILNTNNNWENNRLSLDDFYFCVNEEGEKEIAEYLQIECYFKFSEDKFAKNFLEWAHFEDIYDEADIVVIDAKYMLRVFLKAERKNDREIAPYDIRGGKDHEGTSLNAEAKELLKVTYLKALRDATTELQPRRNSRLAQILGSHKFAKEEKDDDGRIKKHPLVEIVAESNEEVKDFFIENSLGSISVEKSEAINLRKHLNELLQKFFGVAEENLAEFGISDVTLIGVLEKLMLELVVENSGLGSQNLLFIAAELLLLEKDDDFTGLRLALIEEIEAHLHPQAQMRLVEYLQEECDNKGIQMLLTTHSPNLASKVKLENLILFNSNNAYPMGSNYTELEEDDYKFLERFLDVTKSNLFFAKGVIIVEGDAENLLFPTIAKIMGLDLTKHGVSIVSVGGVALKRYANIFLRKDNSTQININVSVVTDLDLKPKQYYEDNEYPTVYLLNSDLMDKFKNNYDLEGKINEYSSILNNRYSTLESLKSAIKPFVKRGSKKDINSFFKLENMTDNEVSIEVDTLEEGKEELLKNKERASKKNIKYCVAKNWTLEYELALSSLRKYFYQAVLLAKSEDKDKAETDIKNWEDNGKTIDDIAYKIYWVIMMDKGKNSLSKPIVIQYFISILEEEWKSGTDLKSNIESDPHLEYIVKAIKHATKTS